MFYENLQYKSIREIPSPTLSSGINNNCIESGCLKLSHGCICIALYSIGPYLHPVQLFLTADCRLFPRSYRLLTGIWLSCLLYPLASDAIDDSFCHFLAVIELRIVPVIYEAALYQHGR